MSIPPVSSPIHSNHVFNASFRTQNFTSFPSSHKVQFPPRTDPHPDIRLARTFALRVHHEVQPLPTRVQGYLVRRRTDSVAEHRRDLPVLDGCNFQQACVKAQPQPLSTCGSAAHETWACFEKNLSFPSQQNTRARSEKGKTLSSKRRSSSRAFIGSCRSKLHMRLETRRERNTVSSSTTPHLLERAPR
jgi:hypothetical protein